MLRRSLLLPATGVVAIGLASGAVAAFATSSTGNQNPELLVKATVTPTHASATGTITATAVITNETSHRLKDVSIDVSFSTPSDETDDGSFGGLGPGRSVTLTYHKKVARFGAGRYELRVKASDRNGRSQARAHATG